MMSSRVLGHAAMLTFSLLVAGSFSLGALIAKLIDPLVLTALRFMIAGLVLGMMAHFTAGLHRKDFRAPWRYFLLGSIFAIYFILMFEGLKTAKPVSTAAIFTLTPIIAAVFGYFLLRQIPSYRTIFALLIGAIGAVWVIFRGSWEAFLAIEVGRGEVIFFVGAIAHALYIPLVKLLDRGESPIVYTFGVVFGGFSALIVIAAPEMLAISWRELPANFWLVLLYLSVFASAATFFLVLFASLHLPSANVMAYTYLVPSWVIIWEVVLGQSRPELGILAGVMLSTLALVILLKPKAVPD